MRPIRRIAFTSALDDSDDPTDFDLLNSPRYDDAYRLMTPTLLAPESERPDPVFEEISGNRFFVRHNPRNFRAIVAKPPAEWGINIEQLRCQSRLGVFLIDDAGVVWARRTSHETAAPIPIEPGTVVQRMLFPSDTTISKYEFSFDFAQDFQDYELVPVHVNKALLTYIVPMAVRLRARYSSPDLAVEVYVLYARAAGDLYIPVEGIASNIRVRDRSGTVVSASFTEVAPGAYEVSPFSYNPSSAPYAVDIFPYPSLPAFDFSTAVDTV